MGKLTSVLVGLILALAETSRAADFFVSPSGLPSGDGSRLRPWDLATALAQPAAVRPGDTIWLQGGTYKGHFRSTLVGKERRPIVVRQYDGERVTLDGNDGTNSVTLLVNGAHTWFWGFEITNSNATRTSTDANPVPGRGEAVNLLGDHTKLVNLVIHDTSQGVLTTTDIVDTEVSGCLIYYNGYDGTDRGHGHGIYIQNAAPSTKRVLENIIFNQFGWGIHAYTESGRLDNLDLEGNTSFNNGSLSQVSGYTTNILLGASGSPATSPSDSVKVAKNAMLKNNYTFFSSNGGTAANLGYSKGIASPTILNNYFVGATALDLVNAFRPIAMTGNSFYGDISGFLSSDFPHNAYYSARPNGVRTFIRPNRYEPGRASITIYNWDRAATVDLDIHSAISVGTHYELRNAQNFFGTPVLSGVYDGSPLHVPMAPLTPAEPVGRPVPAATGPDFQVFVLLPTSRPTANRGSVDRPSSAPRSPVWVQRSAEPSASASPASPTATDLEAAAPSTVPVSNAVPDSVDDNGPCAPQAALRVENPPSAAASSFTHSSRGRGVRYLAEVATSHGSPDCHTSVFIANRGSEPETVTLAFLEHDRDNVSRPSASFIVGPRETLRAEDVLRTFFGASETYGALEVETGESVRVSTSAGNAAGATSVGPAAIPAAMLTPVSTLHDLRWGPGSASNIVLVNPDAAGTLVSLTLLGTSETAPETAFIVVPPRGYVRRRLGDLLPSAAKTAGALLSVAVDAGATGVIALASGAEPVRLDATPTPATP